MSRDCCVISVSLHKKSKKGDNDVMPKSRMKLELSADDFRSMIDPMVIVESFGHIKFGRVRRAYESEFSDGERAYLKKVHDKYLLPWCLTSGLPMLIEWPCLADLQVLQRAANFFAKI